MNREFVDKAAEALRHNGVVLCPSDTIASLSCLATSEQAMSRIQEIKQRPEDKRFIVLVSNYTMLEGLVRNIPEAAYQLMEVSEKPVTMIYPEARNLPESLKAPDGSIGIRVVHGGFITRLINRLRQPILSTSANISGQQAPIRIAEVDPIISQAVDLVVPIEEFKTQPSSIIKFEKDGSFKLVRT